MGMAEEYPGGAAQYYGDLHSGEPARVAQADKHRNEFTEHDPPFVGGSGSGPAAASPAASFGSTRSAFIDEILTWRSLLVWVAAFFAIYALGWWHGIYTTGSEANKIVLLLLLAAVITSPTIRRHAVGLPIVLLMLGVVLALAMWLLTGLSPVRPDKPNAQRKRPVTTVCTAT